MRDRDAVAAGSAALADGRWEDARVAFAEASSSEESPEAFDGLARALHHLGDYVSAIAARERAFAGFRARGETRYPAVLAAYWLAFEYAAVLGNEAVANGWLERAKQLADDSGDCVERGWVALACALFSDDLDETEQLVHEAAQRARRFGDRDLELDALAYAGSVLVRRGSVRDGMRKLDHAVAAASGGEVSDPAVAGDIFCKMLLACESSLDVRRAEEWTATAGGFARRYGLRWVGAICRMHYGGILAAGGRWADAESELTASVRAYDTSFRPLRSGAVARLADLRVSQGRLEDADRLIAGHEHDPYAIRPLARACLARGDADVAVTLLRRHLAGDHDVSAAPVLGLLVSAQLSAGRLQDARTSCARLAGLAATAGTPSVTAFAELAQALVGASTAPAAAVRHLEAAVAGFSRSHLPYEEARTRLELARLLSETEPGVAVAEARHALAVFDRLGAVPDADTTAALLRELGVSGRTGPRHVGVLSLREQEVLRLLGLGLSNPEIAGRLFITRKTAAHHVSSVLAKLGLRNRAEAAAFAAGTQVKGT